jgi:hypothetical protein
VTNTSLILGTTSTGLQRFGGNANTSHLLMYQATSNFYIQAMGTNNRGGNLYIQGGPMSIGKSGAGLGFWPHIGFPAFSTAPTTFQSGTIYFNTTNNSLYVYNGTTWRGCSFT